MTVLWHGYKDWHSGGHSTVSEIEDFAGFKYAFVPTSNCTVCTFEQVLEGQKTTRQLLWWFSKFVADGCSIIDRLLALAFPARGTCTAVIASIWSVASGIRHLQNCSSVARSDRPRSSLQGSIGTLTTVASETDTTQSVLSSSYGISRPLNNLHWAQSPCVLWATLPNHLNWLRIASSLVLYA
jgi:hypothetical protein